MAEQTRGFLEKHAGKFLIAVFVVPLPFRVYDLFWVDVPLSLVFLALAVTGYIQRSKLKKRQQEPDVQ